MRSRTISAALALAATTALALAACSGSGAPEDDAAQAAAPATGSPATTPSGEAVVAELLGLLPAAESDRVLVRVADLAAASAVSGLEHQPQESREWALNVRSRGIVDLPEMFLWELQASEERELGWTISEATGYAEIAAYPVRTLLVRGIGEDDFAPGLTDLGEGVLSAGSGADRQADPAAVTALRQEGVPLRMAAREDLTVVSNQTDAASSFRAGDGATMASHAALMGVATALEDSFGAVLMAPGLTVEETIGASLVTPELLAAIEAEDALVTAPVLALGLGSVRADEGFELIAAYHFADEATAAAQEERVERAWTRSTVDGEQPVSELVTLGEVSRDGATVVATLTLASDLAGQRVAPTDPMGALPFAHW